MEKEFTSTYKNVYFCFHDLHDIDTKNQIFYLPKIVNKKLIRSSFININNTKIDTEHVDEDKKNYEVLFDLPFCSTACMHAYIKTNVTDAYQYNQLLKNIKYIYETFENKVALPIETLEKFGGILKIDEYRNESICMQNLVQFNEESHIFRKNIIKYFI